MADGGHGGLQFSPFYAIAGSVASGVLVLWGYFTESSKPGPRSGISIAYEEEEPLGGLGHGGAANSITGTTEEKNSMLAGQIAGIIAGLIVLAALSYHLIHRRRSRQSDAKPDLQLALKDKVDGSRNQNETLRDVAENKLFEQDKTIADHSNNEDSATTALRDLETSSMALNAALEDERNTNKKLRLDLSNAQSKLESENAQCSKLQVQVDGHAELVESLRARVRDYEPKLSSMKAEYEKSEDALKSQIDELVEAKSDLQATLEQLRPDTFEQLREEHAQVKDQNTQLGCEMGKRNKDKADDVQEIAALKIEKETQLYQIQTLTAEITDLRTSNESRKAELQKANHDLIAEIRTLQLAASDAKRADKDLRDQVNSLQSGIDDAKSVDMELRKQLRDKNDLLAQSESVIAAFERHKAELSNGDGKDREFRADDHPIVAKMIDGHDRLQGELQAYISKCEELQSSKNKLHAELNERQKLGEVDQESSSMQAELLDKEAENQSLRQKITDLEVTLAQSEPLLLQRQHPEESPDSSKPTRDDANDDRVKLELETKKHIELENELQALREEYEKLDKSSSELQKTHNLSNLTQHVLQKQVDDLKNENERLKADAERETSGKAKSSTDLEYSRPDDSEIHVSDEAMDTSNDGGAGSVQVQQNDPLQESDSSRGTESFNPADSVNAAQTSIEFNAMNDVPSSPKQHQIVIKSENKTNGQSVSPFSSNFFKPPAQVDSDQMDFDFNESSSLSSNSKKEKDASTPEDTSTGEFRFTSSSVPSDSPAPTNKKKTGLSFSSTKPIFTGLTNFSPESKQNDAPNASTEFKIPGIHNGDQSLPGDESSAGVASDRVATNDQANGTNLPKKGNPFNWETVPGPPKPRRPKEFPDKDKKKKKRNDGNDVPLFDPEYEVRMGESTSGVANEPSSPINIVPQETNPETPKSPPKPNSSKRSKSRSLGKKRTDRTPPRKSNLVDYRDDDDDEEAPIQSSTTRRSGTPKEKSTPPRGLDPRSQREIRTPKGRFNRTPEEARLANFVDNEMLNIGPPSPPTPGGSRTPPWEPEEEIVFSGDEGGDSPPMTNPPTPGGGGSPIIHYPHDGGDDDGDDEEGRNTEWVDAIARSNELVGGNISDAELFGILGMDDEGDGDDVPGSPVVTPGSPGPTDGGEHQEVTNPEEHYSQDKASAAVNMDDDAVSEVLSEVSEEE